jgi:hypothetical protein
MPRLRHLNQRELQQFHEPEAGMIVIAVGSPELRWTKFHEGEPILQQAIASRSGGRR